MSISQMRYELEYHCKYSGRKWSYKVSLMSDAQVCAIYKRFLAAGLLQSN